jgi:hypothetical protein
MQEHFCGASGYVVAVDDQTMRVRRRAESSEQMLCLPAAPARLSDPFTYLAAVVCGHINELRAADLRKECHELEQGATVYNTWE